MVLVLQPTGSTSLEVVLRDRGEHVGTRRAEYQVADQVVTLGDPQGRFLYPFLELGQRSGLDIPRRHPRDDQQLGLAGRCRRPVELGILLDEAEDLVSDHGGRCLRPREQPRSASEDPEESLEGKGTLFFHRLPRGSLQVIEVVRARRNILGPIGSHRQGMTGPDAHFDHGIPESGTRHVNRTADSSRLWPTGERTLPSSRAVTTSKGSSQDRAKVLFAVAAECNRKGVPSTRWLSSFGWVNRPAIIVPTKARAKGTRRHESALEVRFGLIVWG